LRESWFRALVLYPLLFVGPWVALSWLLAEPEEDGLVAVLGVGFWGVIAGSFASLVAAVLVATRRPMPGRERVLLVVLGVLVSGAALVLGMVGWFQAAKYDCADQYECPI
jgi:drug/metabolite transporter (DMT)-like permease